MSQQIQPSTHIEEEDEIHLPDLLLVLLKRKKMIIIIVLLAIVCSVIYSLLATKIYTATASILPPQKSESGLGGVLAGIGVLEGLGVGLDAKSPAEVFVGILESRTVADMLIERFNLREVYEAELKDFVYRQLKDNTTIQISSKNLIISVSVDDKDPNLAAQMANAYVEALDQVNRKVNITEANRKRMFLEDRLKTVKKDLVAAELALKEFQEKHNLISIEDQYKVGIEGAARIKGEIVVAQTELEVLKQFGTERQNEAIMLKSKIAELEKHLSNIEIGNPEALPALKVKQRDEKPDFYIPFSELPELGLQLVRLTREAKVQEKVYELLTSQYELAKIEEAKDVNTIQVLDTATPPERKSKPKRSLIVILSTFVALFIAIFLSFILEYVERLRTEDHERFQQIANHFSFRNK